MALTIRGVRPSNVFRLYGPDENSASFALGWVLEQSPEYRKIVIEAVFGERLGVDKVVISLQRHGEDGGYTDLEIQAGHQFHAILEAKRWWDLPTVEQFKRYQPRLIAAGTERQRLISVSAASELIGKASRLAGLSRRREPPARSRGDASQTRAKAEGGRTVKRE